MPPAVALNKGGVVGQAIGASGIFDLLGQNGDTRIWVGGESDLTVQVEMTAGAVGDLVVQVNPYESDNATVIPMPLVPMTQPATNPAFSASKCFYTAVYDVSGYDMVRIRISNNNVGAQTLNRATWRLGAGG